MTHIRGVFEVCLPWKGIHTEAGQECEESSSWGWRIGRDMWWTDHRPHPSSAFTTEEKQGDNLGVQLSPGRRNGPGQGALRFGFIFHYATLIWLVIKLISLSQFCFAYDGNWWVISPCLDLNSSAFFFIFSPPCPVKEGIDRAALMGAWYLTKGEPTTGFF